MKVYTVVKTIRDRTATVLYCGEDKDAADETHHFDRCDEPAPDKDDAIKWVTLIAEFPDWD